jgi:putative ubiquitin-RnfH superfamily antitoxin RatB of RatAB toxin-antitoxin module
MAEAMEITVAWSPAPRVAHLLVLTLAQGACVRDALSAAAQDARFADLPAGYSLGIWNKRAHVSHVLQPGDRLEIYRPLRVDPMVARRERFKKQGAKSAGLFATRRPGAKPGY